MKPIFVMLLGWFAVAATADTDLTHTKTGKETAKALRAERGADRCAAAGGDKDLIDTHVYWVKMSYRRGQWVPDQNAACRPMYYDGDRWGELKPGSFVLGAQIGDRGLDVPYEVFLITDSKDPDLQKIEFGCRCNIKQNLTLRVSYSYDEEDTKYELNELLPKGQNMQLKPTAKREESY
jgi:hypothetical protein